MMPIKFSILYQKMVSKPTIFLLLLNLIGGIFSTSSGFNDPEKNTKTNSFVFKKALNPSILGIHDGYLHLINNGSSNLPLNLNISTTALLLPTSGLDNSTVNTNHVKLIKVNSNALVPAQVNSTGGGDAITLVPYNLLEANTMYKFEVTSGVKDLDGNTMLPFSVTFTTGTDTGIEQTNLTGVNFIKVALPNTQGRKYTSLAIGPDHKLYALSIDGWIRRFPILLDGTLGTPENLTALRSHRRLPQVATDDKIAIGMAFDPTATAANPKIWVTYCGSYDFENGPQWDGNLARLSGPNLGTVEDILINLPRSNRTHLVNSIAFGPDGALYFNQGSCSAMGYADGAWGNRPETLLAAAVLRLDLTKLPPSLPINVKTSEGGNYNPYLPNAPLSIYGFGVRNAYDLVWHTNGNLYVPTNGSAAGGNTPTSDPNSPKYITPHPNAPVYSGPTVPAVYGVNPSQRDWLYSIQKNGYYGHPNPLRGEYVLNRGEADVYNPEYIGMVAQSNYSGYAFDFGTNKSPNGVIEYKSNVFAGKLKGKILVVRYSQKDDIMVLEPGGAGNHEIVANTDGFLLGLSGFADPLDLVENTATGDLYVSEHDADRITLVKPNYIPDNSLITATPTIIKDYTVLNQTKEYTIQISNTSNQALNVIGFKFNGANSNEFQFVNREDTLKNYSLAGNTTYQFKVKFKSNIGGLRLTNVIVTSIQDNQVVNNQIELRCVASVQTEPSLQRVLDVHKINVNVGDNAPNNTTIHSDLFDEPLLGNEITSQLFQKADTGKVIIEPLGVFRPVSGANASVVKLGWYSATNPTQTSQLFQINNQPTSNASTFNVNITNGTLSFDPAQALFGLYSEWAALNNRKIYTQDNLNTHSGAIPHHCRVYPLKDANGNTIANSFVVAMEENNTGFEYQDIVFIIRNVKSIRGTTEAPLVKATFKGATSTANVYKNYVRVILNAEAINQTGIKRFQYSTNGVNYVNYTNSLVFNTLGSKQLFTLVEDNLGFTTQQVFNFSIVQDNVKTRILAVENMTKFPGTNQGFPSDSTYAFHKNFVSSADATMWHKSNNMKIKNLGTDTLVINSLNIQHLNLFTINKIDNTPYASALLPIKLPAGDYIELEIEFIESMGIKGVRKSDFQMTSNAQNKPIFGAKLAATYLPDLSHVGEVLPQMLIDAFSFKTSIGKKWRPDAEYPTAADVDKGNQDDLVLTSHFVQADPNKPVGAVVLGTIKSVVPIEAKLIDNNGNTMNNFAFKTNSFWRKSLLPRDNAGNIAGMSKNMGNNPFRISISGETSSGNGGINPATGLPRLLGVRAYKAKDPAGNIIPFAYVIVMETVLKPSCCDWNDEMIYLTNIRPVNLPTSVSIPNQNAQKGSSFSFNVSNYFNKGYAGNKLSYSAKLSDNSALPNWLIINANTGVLSGVAPANAPASLAINITATDVNGIKVNQTFNLNIQDIPVPTSTKYEAELYYSIVNEVGTNPISITNFANFSNGQAVRLVDIGDKINLNFNIQKAGNYILKLHLRVGNTSNSSLFWSNNIYNFQLDNTSITFNGNLSTISPWYNIYGGSHFGTMETQALNLNLGSHSLAISSIWNWTAVDYLEVIYLDNPAPAAWQAELPKVNQAEDKPSLDNLVVKIAPNPIQKDWLTLLFNQEIVGNLSYEIYNPTGYQVAQGTQKIEGNTLAIELAKYNLSVGIYYLKIRLNNQDIDFMKFINP
jgi:large repetitive protein